MNTSIVLMKKEFIQMVREFKVIWLPIVFILLGITQPIITFYLPSILKAFGDQGITIDPSMSVQKGGEVLASTIGSQFDQLGLIILVVSMIGIIHSDKANGMLAFILTRPVSVISYMNGKIIANYLIAALSVLIGYFASYLYVNFLFTNVSFPSMIIGLSFYLLWVLFITAFTAMISTIFQSQSVIALISIVVLLGCRILVGLSPIIDHINPAIMSKHAMEVLITGTISFSTLGHIVITLVWILLVLIITKYWIENKKVGHES